MVSALFIDARRAHLDSERRVDYTLCTLWLKVAAQNEEGENPVKKSVADEIQAAITKAKAESDVGAVSLPLTKRELADLFDMLFALRQTEKGFVPEARDFRFEGKPADVAASAEARRTIQTNVFELFRKLNS